MSTSKIRFCSVDSTTSGESPIGSGWHTPTLIVTEIPLPWPGDTLTGRNIPNGMKEMINSRYETHSGWGLIGCAPDDAYSVPGYYRVMKCFTGEDSLGRFQRRTFLVPHEKMVDGIDGIFDDVLIDGVQEIEDSTRDILLCTQGSVDACCAKFGYPLYALMRKMADNPGSNVRVWRSTHFGGHRFAPTYLDVPSGRYWGRITPQEASGLMHQTRPASELIHMYRGSAVLPAPIPQVVEGALLAELGWNMDRADISRLDVTELEGDRWQATGTVTMPDQEPVEFEVECVQTGIISLKGHCNYDLITDAPQFEANIRVRVATY